MNSKKWLLLALGMFMVVVFVRDAFCDAALDADVNTVSSWWTCPHGSSITMSLVTADTQLAPDGSSVMECTITAAMPGEAGDYAEARWTNTVTPLNLQTYCRMNFWYKIDETPAGAVQYNTMYMTDGSLWANGFIILPPPQLFIGDGQWHQMEWPLYPIITGDYNGQWSWSDVPSFDLNIYLQQPVQQNDNVTFHFGGFHFVPKSASPAYLLLGDSAVSWGNYAPDTAVGAIFSGLGFQSDYAAYDSNLTLDFLEQFNVVVLLTVPNNNQTVANLLLNYVQQGGGLLVLRYSGYQCGTDINLTNSLLSPTGISILSEQVSDNTNITTVPYGTLGWTDNIAADTVTAGVTGLFYPSSIYCPSWSNFTSPVNITSGDWRVLVYGKSTAYSMIQTLDASGNLKLTPGTYTSSPPLLAVGDYYAGRIAVWPIDASCIWQDAYNLFWGGGFMMSGQQSGMSGNAGQLLSNLFTYLWEPNQTIFGGYLPPPPVPPAPPQPINWDTISLTGCDLPNNYVGLIGAQSNMSVGTDSPQAMITAAQNAGYNFICFTEELSYMNSTRWASLVSTCAANCSSTFQAYPGYHYFDQSNNSWVTFSNQLPWFGPYQVSQGSDQVLRNGSFYYSLNYPPVILLSSHANPEQPWYQGGFHGFSVYTYQNGSLVDSSLDNYGTMEKLMFNVYPVAVHLVTSAAQVTAERNIGYQTNVRWD